MTCELFVVDFCCRIGKVELSHRRGGHHMDVAVRYLVTGDDQPHALRSKHRLLSSADLLCHKHEMSSFVVVEIGPVVDFANRNDKRVSWCEGIDGQETDARLIPMYEVRGKVPVDDPGKDARHGSKSSGRRYSQRRASDDDSEPAHVHSAELSSAVSLDVVR